MKERRKRNMSRTGLLFMFFLLIDAMWLCTDYRIYGKYGS